MPHAYVHSRPPEPVLGSDGSFSSELGPSWADQASHCRARSAEAGLITYLRA